MFVGLKAGPFGADLVVVVVEEAAAVVGTGARARAGTGAALTGAAAVVGRSIVG